MRSLLICLFLTGCDSYIDKNPNATLNCYFPLLKQHITVSVVGPIELSSSKVEFTRATDNKKVTYFGENTCYVER